jgi:nitroreductase
MEIKETIYGRRAVREYTAEAVDEGQLRTLIDAAIQAPSAINQQPWLFTVVRDARLLSEISSQAKAFMLRTSPTALASPHFQTVLSDPNFNIFYHAPVLIVISAAAGPWAVEDCALAAQNLMLAAHAAGLGTCWIGFAQSWLATAEGRSVLKLPANEVPVAPIIVGHPKSRLPPIQRKPARIDWVS